MADLENLLRKKLNNADISLLLDIITNPSASGNVSENIKNILQIFRGYLNCDLIEIWSPFVEEDNIIFIQNDYELSDTATDSFIKKSLKKEYTSKQYTATPVWVNKSIQWLQLTEQKNLLVRQKIALEASFKTVIALPVILHTKPTYLIYVYYKQVIPKNANTEKLLNICAKQLSIQLEQSAQYELIQNFLTKSTDLICVTNFKGIILDASDSFYEILDHPTNEILLTNFADHSFSKKVVIDKEFIDLHTNEPKMTFETEYHSGGNIITITWNATVIHHSHSIIFSGKNISEKIEFANHLKKNNLLLKQAYSEISTILTNINELVYRLNPEGNILEINDSVIKLLGYQRNEMIGQSFLQFSHVDEVEELYKLVITNRNNDNIVKNFNHRIKAKNGNWIWLSTSGQTIFDAQGTPLYLLCLSKDIEERYQAEQNSRLLNEKYYSYFLLGPVPTLVLNLEENNIIENNEAASRLYGYSKEEFAKLHPKNIRIDDNIIEAPFKSIKTVNKKENPNSLSLKQKHQKKDGTVFYAAVQAKQVMVGNQLCIIYAVEDITATVEFEIHLKEKALPHHFFQDHVNESFFIFSTQTPVSIHLNISFLVKVICDEFHLKDANPAFANRYGFSSPDQLIGAPLKKILAINKLDLESLISSVIENDFYLKDYELEVVNYLNQKKYYLMTIRGFVENGKLVSIWGLSLDITDSKMARLELEKSLQRFKMFSDKSTDSISMYELSKPVFLLQEREKLKKEIFENAFLSESNEILPKRIGLRNEEVYDYPLNKIIALQNIDANAIFDEFIKNDYALNNFECMATDRDANPVYLSVTLKCLVEKNYLLKFWSVIKNITKVKLEERKTAFLAKIIDQAKDVIYTLNNHFIVLTWNNSAEEFFGVAKEMAIGKSIEALFDPENTSFNKKEIRNAIRRKGNWTGEIEFTNHLNHKQIILYSTVSEIRDDAEMVTGLIINGKDITEKKQTEALVEESEKRFFKIADLAPLMIWQTGKNGEKLFYNKKIAEFTGLSQETLHHTPWEKLVYEEDQQSISLYLQKQINEQQPFSIGYRLKHNTGMYKWILDKAIPRFLPNGEFDGYIGICVDIHDTKQSFEIIKESEDRFRNMADNAPVMIWQTDHLDKVVYYNQGWLAFTGKTLEAELNMPWYEKIYEGDREKATLDYHSAFTKKESFILEYRLISKTNECKWVLDRGTPRFLENGSFAGYIGVCIDIQHLKQTEIELKYANRRYEIINEASNEALYEIDLKKMIRFWSIGFTKLFGHQNLQATNENWLHLIHPDDREKAEKAFIDFSPEAIKKNNIVKCEYRFLKADNTYCIVEDTGFFVFDEEGHPEKIIGTKKDITQQKEMEARLLQTEIDKQVAINKAMIDGQEKEKLGLSLELHDNINQLISSAKLYMEVAKRNNTHLEMIEKSIDTLSVAVQEIRRLSKALNPVTINKLNLVDAIEQLVYDMLQTDKLSIEFDTAGFNYTITLPQLNLYLYRIVQEQINNIIKYAKTNKAKIQLENDQNFLLLKISDKGAGFDINQKIAGIGLSNIRNRVSLFKGTTNIISAPGKGCQIEIKIPLHIDYF
jgi:PAS domain S-box-containing protein